VPFDVNVQMTMSQLEEIIHQIAPRALVRVSPVMDTLVLTGTVPDATSAERIIDVASIYSTKVKNQLSVAGVQQVLIRATVAEVNRRALRQLGVNGWLAGDNFKDAYFINQIGGINPSNIGAARNSWVRTEIPIVTGEDGIPILPTTDFSLGFPRAQMQLFMEALRENGLLRVLAEPNLVAITGEEASFLAGGEIPVPIPQDDGVVTIEWREFGVVLNFVPTVLGGQIIRLDVSPEVSELDFTNAVSFGGFVIPALTKRNVSTVVEVGNGQTFAIAGLLNDQIRSVARKVPGLGDVPVLGALFSSVDYQRSTSELVFLITPELVNPLNPEQVPQVPGEEVTEPNDFELFALGLLEGPPKPSRTPAEAIVEEGMTDVPTLEEPSLAETGEPATQATNESMWIRGPWGPAESEEG
jgi:pilus assembly protein CpaC